MTTEITSLPQLTAEGVPLAQARRSAEATRLANAAAELKARGEAITSRALAEAAHISLNIACAWLRQHHTAMSEPEPMLSALQYSSYSIVDNTTMVPTPGATAGSSAGRPPPDESPGLLPMELEPKPSVLSLTAAGVCPAASHQLLWYWTADAWHCPLCGTARAPARDAWGGRHEGTNP